MMLHINLLPWRNSQRQAQQKKIFWILMIFLSLLGLCMLFMLKSLQVINSQQKIANMRLHSKLAKGKQKIHQLEQMQRNQHQLMAKILMLQSLKINHQLLIRLLSQLPELMPADAYLTLLQRTENQVILEGHVRSNQDISQLMRQMERLAWIRDLQLSEVRHLDDRTSYTKQSMLKQHHRLVFTLKFILTSIHKELSE